MNLLPQIPFAALTPQMGTLALLALLAAAVALLFAGRQVIRALVFLLAGSAGAVLGSALATAMLGQAYAFLGLIAGLLSVGLLSLALLPLGVGLALGYYGYLAVGEIAPGGLAPMVAGLILFVVGAYLAGKILSVASVLLGGLLLFNTLGLVGATASQSIALSGLLAVLGLLVQFRPHHALAGTPAATSGMPGTGSGAGKKLLALSLAVVVVLAAVVYLAPYVKQDGAPLSALPAGMASLIGSNFAAAQSNQSAAGLPEYSLQQPSIANGSAHLTYPPGYATLVNYTVGLINSDRAHSGLGPVVVSTIESGQQHADSMLYYGYFSHWDTQGFKPYMRYTLLGGTGAVEENIAYERWTGPHFLTTQSIEKGLSDLEYQMMYNDSACCSNGHRDNILGALHNRVSIGVAYSPTALYLVEDFENYYIHLSWSVSGNYAVSLSGTQIAPVDPSQITVFYDSYPAAETIGQLNNSPHSYDQGTFIGGVLPPCSLSCPYYQGQTTVHADVWQFRGAAADVQFSLANFVARFGPGVYTVYLQQGTDSTSALTSVSLFVQG